MQDKEYLLGYEGMCMMVDEEYILEEEAMRQEHRTADIYPTQLHMVIDNIIA